MGKIKILEFEGLIIDGVKFVQFCPDGCWHLVVRHIEYFRARDIRKIRGRRRD